MKHKSQEKLPEREKWLFKNKKALKQVNQGIKDSAQGKVKSLGSFAKYAPKQILKVRPDSKGRITLGELASGVSTFSVSRDSNNRIILEPFVEISAREQKNFDKSIDWAKKNEPKDNFGEMLDKISRKNENH